MSGDETDVRDAFGYLVGDEPPLGTDVDAAVRAGRRLRRRRRAVRFGVPVAAIAVVAVAGAVVVDAGTSGTTQPELAVAAAALPLTEAGRGAVDTGGQVSTARGEKLVAAVRQVTPADWTVELDETDIGIPTVDGQVDDGVGSTRLMLSVTNTAGMYTVHPCGDSEFRAGASCDETTLADGSFLSVRGTADWKGIKTRIVVLTRADGTGVSVEVGNYELPPQPSPGATVTADEKYGRYAPVITRDAPLYSDAELVTLVKNVARMSAGWSTEPMRTVDR